MVSAGVSTVQARGDPVVFTVGSACPTAGCARRGVESSRTVQLLGAALAPPARRYLDWTLDDPAGQGFDADSPTNRYGRAGNSDGLSMQI